MTKSEPDSRSYAKPSSEGDLAATKAAGTTSSARKAYAKKPYAKKAYAKRIAVSEEIHGRTSLPRADYEDTFVIEAPGARSDSAERWIRSVFEDAPWPVRQFTRLGWLGFGAKLGPKGSTGHVAGWLIEDNAPDRIRLQVDWAVGLRAQLVLDTEPSSVTLSTFVGHRRRAARIAWPPLVPVHRLTLRYLLLRAARAHARERAHVPRPFVIWYQRHLVNPVYRRTAFFMPGAAVIETTGRVSGLPRRTPVGGRIDGSAFWWVSEFGRHSNYVRNIEADPRVRVQIKGRWHTGTATIVDDDNPRERLSRLPKMNSMMVRMVGSHLLTMRIDLDAPH